jgi:hypothetical protein
LPAIWRSDGERYAAVHSVLDQDGLEVVMTRESPTDPPQLYATSFRDKTER